MNILVSNFPASLSVNGRDYGIKSDYRYSLYTILAFEDQELTTGEKALVMLQNLFTEIPEDIDAAVAQCQYFLNGGKEPDNDTSKNRLYSFSQDAQIIFAAFKQTHNIDLEVENLHWWKFLAYFMDLGQNTTFCQLVSMRKRYYDGTLSKEERLAVRELGDTFFIDQSTNFPTEDVEKMAQIKEAYKKAKEKRQCQDQEDLTEQSK